VRRASQLGRSHVRALVAPGLALVLTAGLVTFGAAPASADISAEIRDEQARLDALNNQAEAAAERFNAGRIALVQAQAAERVASARVARAQSALDALKTQVGAFAGQVFRSGGTDQLTLLVTTGSPQAFLDRSAALNRISASQNALMASLATARHRQEQASVDAKSVADAATQTLTSLEKDKAAVLHAANQAQGVLQDLQVKQEQLVQAAKDAAARQAAQAQANALAAQARANAAATSAFADTQNAARSTPVATNKHYSGNAAQIAVQVAMDQLGKPYVYGAAGPDSYDCSGLTLYAYAHAGISLPHHAASQFNEGRHVPESDLRPGDLVFFEKNLGHMGMYIGNGNFIHAPHSGDVVKISPLSGYYQNEYAGAVRLAG
jgi:cell wall-associated NlpC family hydrolase